MIIDLGPRFERQPGTNMPGRYRRINMQHKLISPVRKGTYVRGGVTKDLLSIETNDYGMYINLLNDLDKFALTTPYHKDPYGWAAKLLEVEWLDSRLIIPEVW